MPEVQRVPLVSNSLAARAEHTSWTCSSMPRRSAACIITAQLFRAAGLVRRKLIAIVGTRRRCTCNLFAPTAHDASRRRKETNIATLIYHSNKPRRSLALITVLAQKRMKQVRSVEAASHQKDHTNRQLTSSLVSAHLRCCTSLQ
jgi:hypothetical protein